ncbi:MAG: porin [Luteibaculaceae bacterium]
MRALLIFLLIFVSSFAFAADSTKTGFSISGFVDVFYMYDFNKPTGDSRQPFLFNHNRHNEFNVNLAFVNIQYQERNYRSTVTLQTGTYASDNYANEAPLMRTIFEANVGLKLSSKGNVWLDAGVLPSHIGFESAISLENSTLTRSLLAENSPYFLTGAKLSGSFTEQTTWALLVVNGWQRIARLQGNSLLSLGTQLTHTLASKTVLNWSTFIGTDFPDEERKMRYFSNFYALVPVNKTIDLIGGFDIGVEQAAIHSSRYNVWFSPVGILCLNFTEKWSSALRLEYFHDPNQVIMSTQTGNDFRVFGFSINADYAVAKNVLFRLEARNFLAQQDIFLNQNGMERNTNFFIGGSIAIKMY